MCGAAWARSGGGADGAVHAGVWAVWGVAVATDGDTARATGRRGGAAGAGGFAPAANATLRTYANKPRKVEWTSQ